MRLIDADELMEWLKNVTITDGIEFETGFKQILLDIKNQPTAYNLEEVVKQLEERLFKMHKLFLREDRDELKYFYQMQMLKEVIEIVRNGGAK